MLHKWPACPTTRFEREISHVTNALQSNLRPYFPRRRKIQLRGNPLSYRVTAVQQPAREAVHLKREGEGGTYYVPDEA